jgi:hypothetical protein
MGSRKPFWDYSIFSDPWGAMEAVGYAVRGALEYNASTGPEFVARVLTEPRDISPVEASAYFPFTVTPDSNLIDSPPTDDENVLARMQRALGLNTRGSKFTFRARIDELHGRLLTDPLTMINTHTEAEIWAEIEEHSQFISMSTHEDRPSRGDLVKVRLQVGDFLWNLQAGEYIGIFERGVFPGNMLAETNTALSPESARDAFSGNFGDIKELGELASYMPDGKAKPISASRLNDKISNAWKWLSPLLPANSVMTSAVRTQGDQDAIIKQYAKRENIPYGSGTPEELTAALDKLRERGFEIRRSVSKPGTGQSPAGEPGFYGHGGGGAFDISGPRLPNGEVDRAFLEQIAAATATAHNDPNIKVSFRLPAKPDPDRPSYPSIIEYKNNCVHVEVNSAEDATTSEINAAIAKYVNQNQDPVAAKLVSPDMDMEG